MIRVLGRLNGTTDPTGDRGSGGEPGGGGGRERTEEVEAGGTDGRLQRGQEADNGPDAGTREGTKKAAREGGGSGGDG